MERHHVSHCFESRCHGCTLLAFCGKMAHGIRLQLFSNWNIAIKRRLLTIAIIFLRADRKNNGVLNLKRKKNKNKPSQAPKR